MKNQLTWLIALAVFVSGCGGSGKSKTSELTGIPNGRLVIYAHRDPGKGPSSYLINQGKMILLGHQKGFPKFSPDGKKIALCTLKDGIQVYDLKGELIESVPVIKSVPTALGPSNLAWDPKSRFLLYTMYKPNLGGGYVIKYTFADRTNQVIGDYGEKVRVHSIAISPQGERMLLFIVDDNKKMEGLYLSDTDGQNLKLIRKNGISQMWHPDGKHIYYDTNRDEEGKDINDRFGRMFKLNLETNQVEVIRDFREYPILAPISITRDGKYFYFSRPVEQGDGLYIVACPVDDPYREIPLTKPVQLAPGQYSRDNNPDWFVE